MIWFWTDESIARFCVVVARVDEPQDDVGVVDLNVTFVQCMQTDELAYKARADELVAEVERTRCTSASHTREQAAVLGTRAMTDDTAPLVSGDRAPDAVVRGCSVL